MAALHKSKRAAENPSKALDFMRRRFSQKTWRMWEALGFHLVPGHQYYPIPILKELERKRPWETEYSTTGIDLRVDEQLDLLRAFGEYRGEYELPDPPGFAPGGDGAVYHAMIRAYEPDRIVEIGLRYLRQDRSRSSKGERE
jgi:hypothetical protein